MAGAQVAQEFAGLELAEEVLAQRGEAVLLAKELGVEPSLRLTLELAGVDLEGGEELAQLLLVGHTGVARVGAHLHVVLKQCGK